MLPVHVYVYKSATKDQMEEEITQSLIWKAQKRQSLWKAYITHNAFWVNMQW